MLRIIQSSSAGAAKNYYAEGLSKEDYYSEGQEIIGAWGGELAARLGLSGQVDKASFDALCDNINPATGKRLTARTDNGRTVGYDINFHCPKSLSVLYALNNDEKILAVFREAVSETMKDIESAMAARVRSGIKDENRFTQNMAWGEFVHFTARPVGGIPDPDKREGTCEIAPQGYFFRFIISVLYLHAGNSVLFSSPKHNFS